MSGTSFTKVYSRKPTQCCSLCRASDSKRSQNACGNFIENRKPTSCCTLKKLIEKNKNRLGGGGNDTSNEGRMHNGGGCCSASKSAVKSTKPLPASSPPPCCRSHKRQQTAYQKHEPPPRRPERFPSVKGNCPCSGSGGQAGHENPDKQTENGCCGSSKSKGLSCK